MLGLVLHPLVLCGILYVVSRGNAEAGFGRVFLIALAIGIASSVATVAFGEALGVLTIIPILAFAVFLLMRFCYVTLSQAVIAVLAFVAYLVGYALLMAQLFSTH